MFIKQRGSFDRCDILSINFFCRHNNVQVEENKLRHVIQILGQIDKCQNNKNVCNYENKRARNLVDRYKIGNNMAISR